jgi:hypothetical protein
VALADVNEDGHRDLLGTGQLDGTLAIFPGDGTGSFGKPAILEVGPNPASLHVVDLDADLHADIVLANRGLPAVSVLLGDGSGGFPWRTEYVNYPPDPEAISALIVGHFDAAG